MAVLRIILSITLLKLCCADTAEDVLLETKNIIISNGFKFESHEVVTEDGYILTTVRIRHPNDLRAARPILLSPAMYGRGEEFMLLGPKKSAAFVLARNGYDVWLLNARGTLFSRKHKFLNPDRDLNYWDFTWHEVGYYDTAANIDYILNVTNNEKMFYLGYSQGGTTYYVLTSARPEYNAKIRAAGNLAPGVFRGTPEKSIPYEVSKHVNLLQILFESLSWFEFFPYLNNFRRLPYYFCKFSSLTSDICLLSIAVLAGRDSGHIKKSRIAYFSLLATGGGSTWQPVHFLQNIRDGRFRRLDLGPKKNFQLYNQTTPPEYDVSLSTAPAIIFYAYYDIFGPKYTIDSLLKDTNGTGYLMKDKKFTHFDFTMAENADKLVYEPLINYLNKF